MESVSAYKKNNISLTKRSFRNDTLWYYNLQYLYCT